MFAIVKTQTLQALKTDAEELRGWFHEALWQALQDHYTRQRLEADLSCARLAADNWRELYARTKKE